MDSDGDDHRGGILGTIKNGLRAYARRVVPRSGECQRCGRTVSTGNPHHPFCSADCAEKDWQAQQW